ncbi:MAG TPA: hypothetical protein VLY65_02595 [Nitrososphaerales archaeon]|nr:hypothetical protein [Nitrososphaerales archaeon]
MKILNLDAREVAAACPMSACIEEMSRAFAMAAEGKFQSPARTRLSASSGDILVMPSLAMRRKVEGSVKVVSIFPGNRGGIPAITAVVILIDGETGETRAMLDGRSLTAIRTGAVSGLSCRFLARRDSKRLGVIGAGVQALEQVRGVVTEVPGIETVNVFSRHLARSKALAKECERVLGVGAAAAERASDCVKDGDIVVTATTSRTPVFDGKSVEAGTHVIAIGSYRPEARELDSSLVSRASIFVDSKEAALEEAGDLLIPMSEGMISRGSIKGELSELVLGRRKGRVSSKEITIFKSVGLALEDNAAGWLAYRQALATNAGTWADI